MYARGYYICLLVNGHQLAIAHTMYLRVQSIFEFQVSSSNPNSCCDGVLAVGGGLAGVGVDEDGDAHHLFS